MGDWDKRAGKGKTKIPDRGQRHLEKGEHRDVG